MAKFDNAKVGDRVWYIIEGWGEVERVIKNVGIRVRFKVSETVEVSNVFTFDGKRYQLNDKYPMLFWNEVKLPTDEEDKKPFDLVEFLRENLEPKEFLLEEHNNTINYSHRDGRFFYDYTIYLDRITEIYFKNSKYEIVEVVQVLNENNITPQQLKQAYKILNWL